jgi:lipopolysaccharide transport system ATP-binding protein
MQVRLAFATAIQREPDILLVDEVLAVGDMDFQQKCLDVFMGYKKKGITMLFVSHDLSSVRMFCDKTLLMKEGNILAFGMTGDIIDRYIYGIDKAGAQPLVALVPEEPLIVKQISEPQKVEEPVPTAAEKSEQQQNTAETLPEPVEQKPVKRDRWGNQKASISDVKLLDKYGNVSDRFNINDPMTIQISYHSDMPINDPIFGIAIYDNNGINYYGTNTDIQGLNLDTIAGDGIIKVRIPSMPLASGKFLLTVAVHTRDHIPYDWHDKKYSFNVVNTGRIAGIFDLKSEWELVHETP